MNEDRKGLILQALADDGFHHIIAAITRISRTKWATGRAAKEMFVDIDWVLAPGRVNSILEGKYIDRSSGDGLSRAIERWANGHHAAEDYDDGRFGGTHDSDIVEDHAEPEPRFDKIDAVFTETSEDQP